MILFGMIFLGGSKIKRPKQLLYSPLILLVYWSSLTQSIFALIFTSFGHLMEGMSSRRWTGRMWKMFGSIDLDTLRINNAPLSLTLDKS